MTHTVYLLHFSKPISSAHTAQHYMGYTDDLETRLDAHAAGNGARFCEVAAARGITFVLARVWPGGRDLERKLKARHESPRLCPICRGEVSA